MAEVSDRAAVSTQAQSILTADARTRAGGAYIPPARLRQLNASIKDPASEAFQRLSWDALRKSLNGLINKVNVSNIKYIAVELFAENLVRGRGLFARCCLKAQASAIPFTPIHAALVAIVNTKLPSVGELILTRLIYAFRRAYRRNDKTQCLAVTAFIAHLVNQQVAHEIIALQILTLLLERPTDDSVEIAVGFMKECGAKLVDLTPKPCNAIFERFRVILHEGTIDKRVQYMIEVLFQMRKDGYKDSPAVREELDLVDEDDAITHCISLDDDLDPVESLNVFRYDPDYVEKEAKYAEIKREILGDSDDEDEEEEAEESVVPDPILDATETNLIQLRKVIYLTIRSSIDVDECAHKLLKINLPPGAEAELCNMIVECCSQEPTYLKLYGLLAERFCGVDSLWIELYEQCFVDVYRTVHRLETNRIRNVAKLFGHLLYANAISWAVFDVVRLNEEETTSASRAFIKLLFQELNEYLGTPRLALKFQEDPEKLKYYEGIFPVDNPRDTRFAINFYTVIGLGGLTEGLRGHLKKVAEQKPEEVPPLEVIDYARQADRPASTPRNGRSRSRSRSRRPRSRSRSPPPRHDRKRSLSPYSKRALIGSAVARDHTGSHGHRSHHSRSRSPLHRRV